MSSSVALGWQRTSRACWSTERLSDPALFRVWPSEEDPAPHTLSSRPTQTGVLTGAALLRVALGPQTRVTRHSQGFTDVSLRPRWKPDLVTSHHLDALRKPVRSTPRRAGAPGSTGAGRRADRCERKSGFSAESAWETAGGLAQPAGAARGSGVRGPAARLSGCLLGPSVLWAHSGESCFHQTLTPGQPGSGPLATPAKPWGP